VFNVRLNSRTEINEFAAQGLIDTRVRYKRSVSSSGSNTRGGIAVYDRMMHIARPLQPERH
jgi:hypothetical protein